MIRKVIPFAAAVIVLLALALGPGRGLLPVGAAARTAAPAPQVTTDHVQETTSTSSVGLAPSPVVNPPASAARIGIAVRQADPAAKGYVIEATVLGSDGKPLPDARVRFYEIVDLFGTREMAIGSSVTDGRGIAAVTFLPAVAGTQDIVARSSITGKVTAGEARRSFDATVAAAERQQQRPLLAQFSDRVPYAAGLIVLSVWALIAFALLATARGVIGGARGTPRKGEPA